MAWVILFLALAILFLLFAFLSFRADLAERKQCGQVVLSSVRRPFPAFPVADAFDPDHALLWDTQIPALQLIATAGREGVPVAHLYPYYAGAAKLHPELYDGFSFWHWIEFLEEAQLITFEQYRVHLTSQGHHFVRNWVGMEASDVPGKRAA